MANSFFLGDRKDVYGFYHASREGKLKQSVAAQYAICKFDLLDQPAMLDYAHKLCHNIPLACMARDRVWASESAFSYGGPLNREGTWQIHTVLRTTNN